MKKKLKISTLLIGIIVAVVALTNTRSYAENLENNGVTVLKNQEVEIAQVIQKILQDDEQNQKKEKCLKFYNANNQLVYECRDKNDERLTILLRRSDLVLQTDSSSYYLLGD
jgi:hypothetical protein